MYVLPGVASASARCAGLRPAGSVCGLDEGRVPGLGMLAWGPVPKITHAHAAVSQAALALPRRLAGAAACACRCLAGKRSQTNAAVPGRVPSEVVRAYRRAGSQCVHALACAQACASSTAGTNKETARH